MPRIPHLLALATLLGGVSQAQTGMAQSTAAPTTAFELFDAFARVLQSNYGGTSTLDRAALSARYRTELQALCAVQSPCPAETAFGVIRAQIGELQDRHTSFRAPNEFQDYLERIRGGNRLQFGVRLGNLPASSEQVVLEVLPGSSAESAGLRRGDRLTRLDGAAYSFAALSSAREEGRSVTLTLDRAGELLTVRLTPLESSTREVPTLRFAGTAAGEVAVLRISTFLGGGGIADEVHRLVARAQAQNAAALVVDLRGNTGGDLIQCDLATSALVPRFERAAQGPNSAVTTVVEGGVRREGMFRVSQVSAPALWEGPLAVLMNAGSASCSEFMAFEVQFAGRGVVVGEPSAGVGNTATQLFGLPGGSGVQLSVVNYRKNGDPYPVRVQPDEVLSDDNLSLSRGQDLSLERAAGLLLGGTQPPGGRP